MEKTTIFLVFQFSQNKIWAFKEMGRPMYKVPDIKGLQFFKMLGTGRNGFSIWPNWGTYAALLVFDSGDFNIENSAWYKRMQAKSSSILKIILSPVKSHGLWNGINPFMPTNTPQDKGGPVAVITRASVKPAQWWRFWWFVPQVSKTIPKDCLFSIGIGELPLIEQATLSLWPNVKVMTDWAYKLGNHQKAIQNTQNYQWYSEEMFTRFEILGLEGSYKNINGNYLWDALVKG